MRTATSKFRIPGLALALVTCLIGGCSGREVGRKQFIRTWILATLRAREKGTEPQEEVEKILASDRISPEAFEEAQVEWFGKDANSEIRQGIRQALDTVGLPSRREYVRTRVLVFLRSRIRETSFVDELREYGEFRAMGVDAFSTAAGIWVGDEETDREIESLYVYLEGALRIPWKTWSAIASHPRWRERHSECWLEVELEKRGIDRDDWNAAEEVHGAWDSFEGE